MTSIEEVYKIVSKAAKQVDDLYIAEPTSSKHFDLLLSVTAQLDNIVDEMVRETEESDEHYLI